MPAVVDERLLVGNETGDDASVVQLSDDIAIVQSLDFFMPIVDDPETFGRIAATNSISDIYAMGATPVSALAILGFPVKKLPAEVARLIMLGGAKVCAEIGIPISGGHSIDDPEPKFGLSVTGVVHPDAFWRNSTGQVGDKLVLTKPLGSGALGSAVKGGRLGADHPDYQTLVNTMCTLNRSAAAAGRAVGVHAVTDVTGFGLLGHLTEMAVGSGLGARIWTQSLPVLPSARSMLAAGVQPGAIGRNLSFFACNFEDNVSDVDRALVADPQTSGGLLMAVSPKKVDALCAALRSEGALAASVVGELVSSPGLVVC